MNQNQMKRRKPNNKNRQPRRKNQNRGVQNSRRGRGRNGPTWDRLPSRMEFTAPRQMTGNNVSRIIHREPLATVNGTVAFAIQTFQINPGLGSVFPWLSAQASGYESYKFNKLTVEYRFTTNEYIGLGRIVIAPDYDSSDSPPTSIIQGEQMTDSVMGAVAKNWDCRLRPRGMGILGPRRFTRSGTLDTNEDIKVYDIAQVHVMTQGQSDGAEIGQLWLNYDVTLYEPQPVSLQNITSAGSYYNQAGTDSLITDLLGTGIVEGALVISHALNVVTISNLIVGQVYLFYFHAVAATITTAPSIAFNAGLTVVNANDDLFTLNGGTTHAYAIKQGMCSQSTVTITLGGITVLTTPSRAVLLVCSSNSYQ